MIENIKKFIKENAIIIAFVLSFILDSQYGILERFIKDPFWLNIVKGLGAVLAAYFTKEKLGISKPNKRLLTLEDEEYTESQIEAVNRCEIILAEVGLELVGTRPKDR